MITDRYNIFKYIFGSAYFLLNEIGFGAERLRVRFLSSSMSNTFVEEVQEMVEHICALGPSPLALKKVQVGE